MYAVDQMSHTEIARVLNITESSSRSQLSRARKMLNDKLKIKMDKKIGGQ
jgi:RNA polymerase sigma-70 factor (ECF subfamily)